MSKLSEYRQSMDTLRFTPEQKARLAAEAAGAVSRETSRRTRRPLGRMAVIAAAVAVVLAVGASAAGVLPAPVDVFAPLFGGSVAQTEVIDKIGHPIGASDTDHGITISADAIIGDRYNACIVYTITREDGTIFDYEPNEAGILGLTLQEGWIDIKNAHGGRENLGYHGQSYFMDLTPGDNAIQYIQQISSDAPLNTGTATADLKNIGKTNWETGELETIAKGRWKLRFDMDYEDSAIYLGNGETFSQDGLNFTIDEISVSPIAVSIAYTADGTAVWSDAPSGRESDENARESARFLENVEILLTKTDGTVIDLSNSGGSMIPDAEKDISHCTKSNFLEEIIPLAELESISVGGVVFPIPAE